MTDKTRQTFSQFAITMGAVYGFIRLAKTNDELATELAARGVSKKDLDAAEGALHSLADKAFYSVPQPV